MTPAAGLMFGLLYWLLTLASFVGFVIAIVSLVRIARALEKIAGKYDSPQRELEEMKEKIK